MLDTLPPLLLTLASRVKHFGNMLPLLKISRREISLLRIFLMDFIMNHDSGLIIDIAHVF